MRKERRYRYRVKAPVCTQVHGRRPLWEKAHVDHGGTDIFGPGPYLKLYYTGGDFGQEVIMAPRIRPSGGYENRKVELEKDEDGVWWWVITKPMESANR